MGIELRGIREKVGPFNKNKKKVATNPFKEGDIILIHQQPMERTHKLSLKWRGPYKVTKVSNPFQVQYNDEGREKGTNVRNCKKFHGQANDGNERHATIEGCLRHAKVECQVRRQRRMTNIIDVLARGSKWPFKNPAHFCKWLRERETGGSRLRYTYGEYLREGARAVQRLPNSLPSNFGCLNLVSMAEEEADISEETMWTLFWRGAGSL